MSKAVDFINLLNIETNFLLKPKKETRSKTIIYIKYSLTTKIVDMFQTVFQGKFEREM